MAGLTQFSSAGGNPEPVYSSPDERRSVTVEVCEGVWLDHRKALVMPTEGWMAVADLHYGFEVHRRAAHGALLPDFGMAEVEERLLQLVRSYDVKKLILVGDIMDGAGSANLTADFLDRMEVAGPELICVAGNHDRAGLKSRRDLIPFYAQGAAFFHHGHQQEAAAAAMQALSAPPNGWLEIQGHLHPSVRLGDHAGLRVELPALVELPQACNVARRFVLPAFSPWARGGRILTPAPIAQWACAKGGVLPL